MFPFIEFPRQLPLLIETFNSVFCIFAAKSAFVSLFNINVHWILRYVNDQTIQTCALIFLSFINHSQKNTTKWHFQTECFKFSCPNTMIIVVLGLGKGKAFSLQALRDPNGSRKLRFPDFVTTTQDGGRLSGWVDLRALVLSEGFYVNEKFHWHQLGSNQRPSDL